jgi:sulfite reductase (ferredoxin)
MNCVFIKQNIVLRNIKEENLPFFYQELAKLDFVTLGYDTINDITACPGTDTCNLELQVALELPKN